MSKNLLWVECKKASSTCKGIMDEFTKEKGGKLTDTEDKEQLMLYLKVYSHLQKAVFLLEGRKETKQQSKETA